MVRVPGSHTPNIKNRSSKYLICLTKHKSIYRTMSNAALAECKDYEARKEENRRVKKNSKKQAI